MDLLRTTLEQQPLMALLAVQGFSLGVGSLCKHNATISAAEGGCQSEIGVASSMAAGLIAQVHDASPLVLENAAESALQHHLGMTCDPVAGDVRRRASSGAPSER